MQPPILPPTGRIIIEFRINAAPLIHPIRHIRPVRRGPFQCRHFSVILVYSAIIMPIVDKALLISALFFLLKIEIPRRTGEGFLFLQAFIVPQIAP